jgi:hypothetical protein
LEVELLVSDIPEDSRRAENRVKLDSVPEYLNTGQVYMASAEYIYNAAYPVCEKYVTHM